MEDSHFHGSAIDPILLNVLLSIYVALLFFRCYVGFNFPHTARYCHPECFFGFFLLRVSQICISCHSQRPEGRLGVTHRQNGLAKSKSQWPPRLGRGPKKERRQSAEK